MIKESGIHGGRTRKPKCSVIFSAILSISWRGCWVYSVPHPKGNVPDYVLEQLQRLKREISAKRQILEAADRLTADNTLTHAETFSLNPLRQELSELQSQREEVLKQIKPIDPSYQLTQTVQPISFGEILETPNLIGKIEDYLLNLLCCRSKILFAYHQARLCYWEARQLYSKIETQVQIFNHLPTDSAVRLETLKKLITTVSRLA